MTSALQEAARLAAVRSVWEQDERIARVVEQATAASVGVYVEYDTWGNLVLVEPNRRVPCGEVHELRRGA